MGVKSQLSFFTEKKNPVAGEKETEKKATLPQITTPLSEYCGQGKNKGQNNKKCL